MIASSLSIYHYAVSNECYFVVKLKVSDATKVNG